MKKITILGGGPAGYAAALYASHFKLDVTLIEADGIGIKILQIGDMSILKDYKIQENYKIFIPKGKWI